MSDNEKKHTRKLPPHGDATQATQWKQDEELARKLPDDTQPAEERGERLAHGKTIAGGGHVDRGT